MPHFSEEAWADFVRGVGVVDRTHELQAHLTAGCPECKADFDLWRGMERFATGESEYTPPENLVRLVKLGFAGTEANESESAIASLVYDSLLQPLAAGVRTGSVSTRQLVFEVEGLTVDLRFERQPQSSRIYASGQVLDKQAPLCWPGNATVVLWMGKEKVTAAEANKYGEFQFEFEATRDLRVSIATIDRKTLWIPLGSLD